MRWSVVALALALALASGCTSYSVTGGPTRSDGSVFVGGIHSGYGLGLEAGGARAVGGGEIGVYGTADRAGYAADGDGESIDWLGASLRYRHVLGSSTGIAPFFAVGGGPGYDDYHLVLEGFAELGVRVPLSAGFSLTVGLRDRPAGFIADGNPAVEPHNSVQLAVGIEVRPVPGRAMPASEAGIVRR